MTNTILSPTISAFRFYWIKMSPKQRAELREALGKPQNSTFYTWLNDPGSMRLDKVQIALEYLEEIFPEISIKELLKKV